MTTPTLSPSEQHRIEEATARLEAKYSGSLDPATVQRSVAESLDTVLDRAHDTGQVPKLVERFADDRLRATQRLKSDQATLKPSVLFLCVHNAGRSQMASGWMRYLSEGEVDVFSGGSEPADQVNPAAVAAMAEVGVDITQAVPQPWADDIVRAVDVVVSMGCGDVCPVYPGKRYVDWQVEDPAGQGVEAVRPIRDEIEQRVRTLLTELDVAPVAEG
jgi:protein-tyrosine-phosphatase